MRRGAPRPRRAIAHDLLFRKSTKCCDCRVLIGDGYSLSRRRLLYIAHTTRDFGRSLATYPKETHGTAVLSTVYDDIPRGLWRFPS